MAKQHRSPKGQFTRQKMCRNPQHKGHLGFETLEKRIERTEHAAHPSYTKARLKRIGAGAAARVYRERLAKGKGR